MTHRMASTVVLVGGILLSLNGQAAAEDKKGTQSTAHHRTDADDDDDKPSSTGVNGSGTPGTIPLWTGTGRTLTDSHIKDNGVTLTASEPLQVTVSGGGPAVSGSNGPGVGVSGNSSTSNGVVGFTSATTGQAGVAGFGVQYGVIGFASATDVGWGVKGVVAGNAVGVEGDGNSTGTGGVGVRGVLFCGTSGCAGDAGQFLAAPGGNILHGFVHNFFGPGGDDEKFVVDTAGNLSIYGNAFKPGGGSWSTLSDRRAKKSIEPLSGALSQFLKLRGTTYEYAKPSAFGELPGTHIGMIAQDVEQVFPSWVDTGADGYKRLTFRGFEAVAVEAVRELDAQLSANSQEAMARIADLERQNAELRHAIAVLSESVKTLQQK